MALGLIRHRLALIGLCLIYVISGAALLVSLSIFGKCIICIPISIIEVAFGIFGLSALINENKIQMRLYFKILAVLSFLHLFSAILIVVSYRTIMDIVEPNVQCCPENKGWNSTSKSCCLYPHESICTNYRQCVDTFNSESSNLLLVLDVLVVSSTLLHFYAAISADSLEKVYR